jgi:GT2 family glycosyltransferase
MITVVMTYWNRPAQLARTLESFKYSSEKDFKVLIVDNNSDKEVDLPKLPYEVKVERLSKNHHYLAAHNIGFHHALKENPEIIIMQHAECYHQGDVISYAKGVTDGTYISFGCYSLGEGETPDTVRRNNRCMEFNGDSAWYNHPVYRPRNAQFCSAITTSNLIKLNGFDERFCEGTWFDDDYFVVLLKRIGLQIELTEQPFVFHQWHPDAWPANPELIYKNRDLYESIKDGIDHRSVHTITPDLK